MNIIIGGILGFISISIAAYADHNLKNTLSAEYYQSITTAVRYNQLNAVLIVALGLAFNNNHHLQQNLLLRWASHLLIVGTVLFCFSIYAGRIFDIETILILTPLGGIIQQASWLLLTLAGFKLVKHKNR